MQGSFRLGTAIKPASGEEDYDIDMVCRLDYEKSALTQAELKRRVGVEIKAYGQRYGMSKPANGRRCWTLIYADGAQFHMDILPAVPDVEKRGYDQEEHLSDALFSILQRMDRYITHRNGVDWVENPADPAENFADKWEKHTERRAPFYEWLQQARNDFAAAS